jgi:protein-S-isoprenylcysteine O-methyltransferase Ste14
MGVNLMSKNEFSRTKMRLLDIFEQVVVLALYLWFIVRLWPGTVDEVKLYTVLVLLSESIVVVLLLVRRPTENISISFRDWFVALSCTSLPLLIIKGGEPLIPPVGVFLMLWGLLIHVGAKLSLLRSFGIVPADRGVKAKGLYSMVRHPMYAGYFSAHLGYLLATPSLWNLIVYMCCWGLLLSRIFAEEKLLLRSPDYQEYTERVPYRVIPGVF